MLADRRRSAAAIALAVLALAACRSDAPGERADEPVEATTGAVEDGGDADDAGADDETATDGAGDVTISGSEGEVSVGEGGDLTISGSEGELSFREGGDLPESLPADVPLPPDYEVATVTELTQSGGQSTTVQFATALAVADAFSHYESALPAAGFDVHTSQQGEGSAMLAARLGGRNLLVNIVAAPDGDGSAVTLTHLAPPE